MPYAYLFAYLPDRSPIIHARHAFGELPPASVAGNANVVEGEEREEAFILCLHSGRNDRWRLGTILHKGIPSLNKPEIHL